MLILSDSLLYLLLSLLVVEVGCVSDSFVLGYYLHVLVVELVDVSFQLLALIDLID